MIMSCVYTVFLAASLMSAALLGKSAELAAAVPKGAQAGIELALTMAGSLCLWTGAGKLMEKAGLTAILARFLRPLLHKVFPASRKDSALSSALSANICANFLGLGNAATPMGIRAARLLRSPGKADVATHQLCRLIVLNTASIQLIPTTVAAVRVSLGSERPFDILPAVWITSLCSAGLGVCAACVLGKLWPHD